MWPSDCVVLFSPLHSLSNTMQTAAPVPLTLVCFHGNTRPTQMHSNGCAFDRNRNGSGTRRNPLAGKRPNLIPDTGAADKGHKHDSTIRPSDSHSRALNPWMYLGEPEVDSSLILLPQGCHRGSA
jgi:hypothetical protein